MSAACQTEALLPPSCSLGYTESDLDAVLGDRLPEFRRWFRGQTGVICEGRRYDHQAKEYRETGCGPHGFVVYAHDLERFLSGEEFS